METQLMKPIDVARILQISRALAYRLMAQGEIPSVRFGRTVRVCPDDLEAFIARNAVSARNPSTCGLSS
jgi:excisionase family DNA binding protein